MDNHDIARRIFIMTLFCIKYYHYYILTICARMSLDYLYNFFIVSPTL